MFIKGRSCSGTKGKVMQMSEKRSPTKTPSQVERTGNRLRPTMPFTPVKKKDKLIFSLRARLFVLFIIITLIPMALLSYLNLLATRQELETAASKLLLVGASQTAAQIDEFLSSSAHALTEEALLPEISAYLALPDNEKTGSPQEAQAQAALEALFSRRFLLSPYIQAYMLLTPGGDLALSTDPRSIPYYSPNFGLGEADAESYNQMTQAGKAYISPVLISPTGRTGNLFFAAPVTNSQKETLGVITMQYDAQVLQSLVARYNGLAGSGSYASVYDELNIRLADGFSPDLIFKTVAPVDNQDIMLLRSIRRLPSLPSNELMGNNPSLAQGLSSLSRGETFFTASTEGQTSGLLSGAVVSLKTLPWKVVFVQPQTAYLAPVQQQTKTILYLSGVFLILSTMIAFVTTRRLTSPISRLTHAAERVTSGDLWIRAPEGNDEVGLLGNAFNIMTSELRRTLEGLEQRVAERTADLARASSEAQRRATQLEIISDVIRTIASIQDHDQLLSQVAQLISERFRYYHTGIFLIDKASSFAILKATNSEGGQRMLQRNHRLKVGEEGIVGYVTANGQPRIAHDVGKDAVFFDNPDLPYTRSEMALPLKVGNEIIGALDVQTMEQSAFSEEDVNILSTLADQVSLAIENVRLYSETRSALEEMKVLHRQYLREAWNTVSSERSSLGYQYDFGALSSVQSAVPEQLWKLLEESDAPVVADPPTPGENEPAGQVGGREVMAPIKIRGHLVGMVKLQEGQQARSWTEDELGLIHAVADQIGLAIENARLIQQTQRRAEREHLVAEITSRMRASNDPQQIIETASRELRRALGARETNIILPASAKPAQQLPLRRGNEDLKSKDSTGIDQHPTPRDESDHRGET
jgi:GAF domain-containing protein/HAMP domain-containing protein